MQYSSLEQELRAVGNTFESIHSVCTGIILMRRKMQKWSVRRWKNLGLRLLRYKLILAAKH
jgi:hypothetical protein